MPATDPCRFITSLVYRHPKSRKALAKRHLYRPNYKPLNQETGCLCLGIKPLSSRAEIHRSVQSPSSAFRRSLLSQSPSPSCRLRMMPPVALVSALLLVVAFAPIFIGASDQDPLQDFCVAKDPTNPNRDPIINGFACKSVAETTAEDFKYTGLVTGKDTNNPLGVVITKGFVTEFPGINTQGISLHRIDFAKGGLNPPHHHARATEIIFLVEGELVVGFVPSQGLKLYETTLKKGEVFVFPRGSLIFMKNVGPGPAWVISAINTQYSPAQNFASALFGSGLPVDVLSKNLGISEKQVEYVVKQHKAQMVSH